MFFSLSETILILIDGSKGVLGTPPSRFNFFHINAAFGKKLPNNRLANPHLGNPVFLTLLFVRSDPPYCFHNSKLSTTFYFQIVMKSTSTETFL